MKKILNTAILAALFAAPAALAQNTAPSQSPASAHGADASGRASAYYYFTIGHLDEQEFETTGSADLATESIESYKKALGLNPGSVVIREQLAEIEAESQETHDAVLDAQEVIKTDPNNVEAHRLLARIYVRTLGDLSAGEVQQDSLDKAIEQFQAILKVQPDDSYSALWLSRLYSFEGKHAEAEQILRGVLARNADDESALEQLSQLLMDQDRFQDAIDLLKQAASDSSSPQDYDLLGEAYSQAKEPSEAEAAYRKAVEGDPDDPGHRHGLAQALESEDKYADALEQYKKLAELEPGTANDYLHIAQLERQLGQYDEAETSLQRAKQLAPGSLEVLYNQAQLDEDQGHYDDAVKALTDAIAGVKSHGEAGSGANPDALAALYEGLGQAYRGQQNYPAAIGAFEEMGKLGPDSEKRAELLLIDTYRESRDIDRAIAEAKTALGNSPGDATLTVTLAMLYGEKFDTATGTKLLQGLLKGNDSDQEIYIDIAQVDESGHQYADAEQSAEKAEQMAHQPSDKETAWFMLGAIYERQKKYDQAEEQFRKVLEVNPNNAATLNYFGYMLADRGVRLDEATSLIERAVKEEPNNGAYLDSLGWAYYRQNKLAEAEEYLSKAVAREGNDPTILSHLGNVYLKLGQNERAAQLLEHSLAEWQKVLPADYEADKASEVEAQLKTLKRRLAQKTAPGTPNSQ
ncbi:MAG: tetratricopeptide repeat protein [Candidatus Acidiferrales bacterium]